ncbi:hypothetical protein [Paracoccus sanguinis]|uniref:hypothetical protein n=1 Tax=Paracoccus sanguinis TaxID=1545044 RepID=UPI0011152767|nr:hypothetical protein [Paracoccus sanguinis]
MSRHNLCEKKLKTESADRLCDDGRWCRDVPAGGIMSRAIAVHLEVSASRLIRSGGIMALMKLERFQNTSAISRRVPAADLHGCMNGHAAPVGRSWADRLRRAAALLVLLGFAVFTLQAAVQPALAGHMTHASQTAAAAYQGCAHFPAAGGMDSESVTETGCSDDSRSSLRHDCCIQFCTFVAVLPEMSLVEPTWADDVLPSLWSHRSGRALDGVLRPPRLSASL